MSDITAKIRNQMKYFQDKMLQAIGKAKNLGLAQAPDVRKVLEPHEQALVILSEAIKRIQKDQTEVHEHIEYIEKVEEDLVELKDVDFIKLKDDFEEFKSTVETKLSAFEEKMPNSSLFEVHA